MKAMEQLVTVPGRVNLIGEHIDYHNLPVLPMAIGRRIRVSFAPRGDRRIRAVSRGFGEREFEWTARLEPEGPGDWANYVKAAAQAVADRWGLGCGLDARVESDLPPAAGLASSSALLVAFTLALLRVNGIRAGFPELMEVLPEAEYFVGTRGGGMDHAAVLASRAGCALLVHFAPAGAEPVPVPGDWAFLVAHSLATAEKSSGVKAEYNARRAAGNRALEKLGYASYREARAGDPERLADGERDAFLHVTGERERVAAAVRAMRDGDAAAFGRLLNESHDSLRDRLRVSSPALDRLVEMAREEGALGARLTGAGFGGCAVIFTRAEERGRIASALAERYYAGRPEFRPETHLMAAEPAAGALYE